jgi:ubiquinone/menaquinone biosynthesis C-methylase UbiE
MAQNVKPGDQKFSLARNDLKMAHIYDVGSKDIQTVMGRYVAIEKMKIALGDRVIDFGCGPGNLDFDIADIVGRRGMSLALIRSRIALTLHARRSQKST